MLTISVLLAVVEVGRVGLAGSGPDIAVAVVATVLFLPLHVWHLRYGLRGERPPGSYRTLAALAVVHVVTLWWIGPGWFYMLAALATSALIVLRPPWSWAVLAGCATAPVIVLHADRQETAFWSTSGLQWQYLSYSVVFRCFILFALIWLVAAAHQLAASRSALAAEAVEHERMRVESEVRESLEQHVHALATANVGPVRRWRIPTLRCRWPRCVTRSPCPGRRWQTCGPSSPKHAARQGMRMPRHGRSQGWRGAGGRRSDWDW